MKQVDTGGLLFNELRRRDKYYVDKSLLIRDILGSDDSGIHLFTRPRRFGKTTNLSMLDAFLNVRYKGNTWFDDLAISKYPEYEIYRNAFPVLNINLKGTRSPDFDEFLKTMTSAILQSLKEHLYLFQYPDLTDDERQLFDSLSRRRADREQLRTSASVITHILERYHDRKVVVLIDEYDRAVADSFGRESHRPVMDFLMEFMHSTFENNDSLQLACLTGVMRIHDDDIFPDIGHVRVDDIFSNSSDDKFGFTEDEVMMVLGDYGHREKMDEVREWYSGYRFGKTDMYNPFAVMEYISDGFEPRPYWSDSGGDVIFRWVLERMDERNLTDVTSLFRGESIRVKLLPSLRYGMPNSNDVSLYSLMAMTGYIRVVDAGHGEYDVSIPNLDIHMIVERILDEIDEDTDLILGLKRTYLGPTNRNETKDARRMRKP